LCAYLFNGVDLHGPITPAIADTIVDRIMAKRFTLAAFGVVGPKWGRIVELDGKRKLKAEDRDGHIVQIKRPRYPMREVVEIFDAMGLELEAGKRAGNDGARVRSYRASGQSVEFVQALITSTWGITDIENMGNVDVIEPTPAKPCSASLVLIDPLLVTEEMLSPTNWTSTECPGWDDVPVDAYDEYLSAAPEHAEDTGPDWSDDWDDDLTVAEEFAAMGVRVVPVARTEPVSDPLASVAANDDEALGTHDAIRAELIQQGLAGKRLAVALALANEATCLMSRANALPHGARTTGHVWLPLTGAHGQQVGVRVVYPSALAHTGEYFCRIEENRFIVLPCDIDLSRQKIRETMTIIMSSPSELRRLRKPSMVKRMAETRKAA